MASKQPTAAEPATTSLLLEEGKTAYNDKRYRNALEIFNKALTSTKSQPSVQLQVLDHLVGVHVKLQELDLALTTAKSMVRCDRSDSRGYLRCGQVKKLEEDYEAERKWYEHGLKNVKAGDRLRPFLELSQLKSTQSARNKLVHSNPYDPMAYLPFEIVQFVLAYLDYKEHTKLLGVSKAWERLISGLPPITNTIDFSCSKRQIPAIALRAAVRRLHCYPTKVMISGLRSDAITYLSARLELWSKRPTIQVIAMNVPRIPLKGLCLQNATLRTLMLGSQVFLCTSDVETILRHCLNLSTLAIETSRLESNRPIEFGSSFCQEKLRTLIVNANIEFQTFAWFPNLVHLEYHRRERLQHPMVLDLLSNANLQYVEISVFEPVTILPLGIKTFKTRHSGQFYIAKGSSPSHFELCFDAPRLSQYVRLVEPGELTHIGTLALEFDHSAGTFESTELELLFDKFSSLEYLRIKSDMLGDADLCGIAGKVPKLRSLVIEDARITGAFLADLIKTQPCRIESIGLRRCSMVSPDTWDWMRQRGILVDVKHGTHSTPMDGGRRLVDLR